MDINSSIRMTDLRKEMPLLRQEEARSIISSSDSLDETKQQEEVELR
jgi:hypothetical protein